MPVANQKKQKSVKLPYKISRDYDILEMAVHGAMTPKEIAAVIGVTESCVRHTLSALKNIDTRGDVYDYIDMGIEYASRLDEAGCEGDIDRQTTLIMNELWVNGFINRKKFAKMTEEEKERFCASHRVRRAGNLAIEVFLMWQADTERDMKPKAKK